MINKSKPQRYISFGKKLFVSYMALLIIPIFVIGYYSYTSSIKSFKEKTRSTIHGTLSQIRDNIDYKMDAIKNISDDLYFDQTMQDILSTYEEDYFSYDNMSHYLSPKLTNIVNSAISDIWVNLYIDNSNVPEIFFNRGNEINPLSAGKDFEIMHKERLEAQEWYRNFNYPDEVYGQTLVWSQVDKDTDFGNVSLLRRLINFNNSNKEIGFIRIITRISDLFKSVDYKKITETSSLVILNENGKKIYYSSPEGEFNVQNSHSDDYLIIEEELSGLNWKLLAYIPQSFFQENADKVRNVIFIVCIINLLILIMVGALFSRYFTRRVTKIIMTANYFREGDFYKRIHFKSRDEFSEIGDAFNDMGKNIEALIQNLYVSNLQKKEAELESLQAQINPHFLYNTLSSISQLAKFGELQKLQKTVLGLAKFYRLSLNEGRIFTTVDKEIEHAKTYVGLQKVKYEDHLQVLYDIDPQVLQYKTIKLILQPFIENALQHAWFGDQINIRITVQLVDENIVFRIIDDGVGISREILEQILDLNGVQIGYGIRNVDMRVKLQFGEEYGVALFSRRGIGTSVSISIPISRD
ncbi:sensor histidine kinase [Paenibacillus psychroresistens]|uniref:histidine kinase n=1 Tax=Paenibacillus psychroresistens TaxID=1778678 RepID=A0A6B8RR86_9BACL|nr:sensor histidine kinase [Paenibacillus psychroresistens]QGQ98367.1 sensor histidine kinase [Paenibacillus psychroresistens]